MEKDEFTKVKGNICNIPVEIESVHNALPRTADNNELIVVQLKRHLKVYSSIPDNF